MRLLLKYANLYEEGQTRTKKWISASHSGEAVADGRCVYLYNKDESSNAIPWFLLEVPKLQTILQVLEAVGIIY